MMEQKDETKLVPVTFQHSNALFQVAKSLLHKNGIKFWTNVSTYHSEIKVFKKDEEAANKILSELTSNQYIPSNKFDKKVHSFIGYWGVVIIIVFILIMVTVFLLLK